MEVGQLFWVSVSGAGEVVWERWCVFWQGVVCIVGVLFSVCLEEVEAWPVDNFSV